VTASAALEQKLVKPNDWVDTNPGVIRFGARVIDEDKHHNYGVLTFTDVLVRSSNVGAIKIGLRVGAERLGLYARRFGFGRPTSPDFPSESPGILWDPARQTESALASMSMGYQVGVTPLQMASAVSSVANGGELVQPRVIRAVIRDGVRKPVPRKVLGRTVDGATAAEVTSIMEAVIERGTGQTAQIDGYTIAGKTGTAQKVENGRYSNTDYNVSFVGFVPSRKPAFTIVVVVDSPHRVPPYGATVAAPIFQRIAAAALRQYGVPRSLNPAPPVLAVRREADVHEQPTSTAGVGPNIVTLAGGEHSAAAVFPDMRGLSARDALRMLARLGMTARLNGAGVVVNNSPKAGAPIDRESAATLWLNGNRIRRHDRSRIAVGVDAGPEGRAVRACRPMRRSMCRAPASNTTRERQSLELYCCASRTEGRRCRVRASGCRIGSRRRLSPSVRGPTTSPHHGLPSATRDSRSRTWLRSFSGIPAGG
jgi:membrane peptidoglycan carboxypeptidase